MQTSASPFLCAAVAHILSEAWWRKDMTAKENTANYCCRITEHASASPLLSRLKNIHPNTINGENYACQQLRHLMSFIAASHRRAFENETLESRLYLWIPCLIITDERRFHKPKILVTLSSASSEESWEDLHQYYECDLIVLYFS